MPALNPLSGGIHGVVADLLDVPKEYETAIETALGGSIQNVVTDSEETAKILIGHLKKNRYGPGHLPSPDRRFRPRRISRATGP